MAIPPVGFTETVETPIDTRYLYLASEGYLNGGPLSVIARIEDLEAWKALADVKTRAVVKENSGWIVTAQIPASRFIEFNKLPFVTSLKVGQPLMLDRK